MEIEFDFTGVTIEDLLQINIFLTALIASNDSVRPLIVNNFIRYISQFCKDELLQLAGYELETVLQAFAVQWGAYTTLSSSVHRELESLESDGS